MQVAPAGVGAVATDAEIFVHPVAESPHDVLLQGMTGFSTTHEASGSVWRVVGAGTDGTADEAWRATVTATGLRRGPSPPCGSLHLPPPRSGFVQYPLLAHLAQTGQILRLRNRPGNVHGSRGAARFLRELIRVELRGRFGRGLPLEFRMDAAFPSARSWSCSPKVRDAYFRAVREGSAPHPLNWPF